jgi:hypothetical protein
MTAGSEVVKEQTIPKCLKQGERRTVALGGVGSPPYATAMDAACVKELDGKITEEFWREEWRIVAGRDSRSNSLGRP